MRIYSVLSISFIILFTAQAYCQKPEWIDASARASMFPESKFLVGFASQAGGRMESSDELLEKVSEYSRIQLIESIWVDIRSIGSYDLNNSEDGTQETFRKNSVSFSNAQISGLKTETFYDPKKKEGYAITYASKEEVLNLYTNNIKADKDQIRKRIAEAEKDLAKGNRQHALYEYFNCLPVFRKIEEAQTLLAVLHGAFKEDKEHAELKALVSDGVQKVKTDQQFNIDDAAYFMAFGFKAQIKELDKPVMLSHFTYHDSQMASTFSKRLYNALEQKLTRIANYQVIKEMDAKSSISQTHYAITGTYWEENNEIRITATLRELRSGKALASMESAVPLATVKAADLSYKPDNYDNAVSVSKILIKDEVKANDLQLDIWTNKGMQNLVYSEGEKMNIFLKANKECYVRIIYHLASGEKVLLLDNYFINSKEVNQIISLPYTFVCAAPFGAEILQVNAQSKKFPVINTKSEDGYHFINEDLHQVLINTRGFKRLDDNNPPVNDLLAEKRLTITTIRN